MEGKYSFSAGAFVIRRTERGYEGEFLNAAADHSVAVCNLHTEGEALVGTAGGKTWRVDKNSASVSLDHISTANVASSPRNALLLTCIHPGFNSCGH